MLSIKSQSNYDKVVYLQGMCLAEMLRFFLSRLLHMLNPIDQSITGGPGFEVGLPTNSSYPGEVGHE